MNISVLTASGNPGLQSRLLLEEIDVGIKGISNTKMVTSPDSPKVGTNESPAGEVGNAHPSHGASQMQRGVAIQIAPTEHCRHRSHAADFEVAPRSNLGKAYSACIDYPRHSRAHSWSFG